MTSFHYAAIILVLLSATGCSSILKEEGRMKWKIAGELPSENGYASPGVAGPLTGSYNNLLIIGGGANFPEKMPWEGGKKIYHNDLVLFVEKSNFFSPLYLKKQLPYNLAYSANCTTPKGIIAAGGENETGILSQVLLISLNKNNEPEWSRLPDLPVAVTGAAAATDGKYMIVAGGDTKDSTSSLAWVINLDDLSTGWRTLTPVPVAVSNAVIVYNTAISKFFLAGGRTKTSSGITKFHQSVFSYDLFNNKWEEVSSIPYPLAAGTGVAIGNEIFLIGGDKGIVYNKTEELIKKINQEPDVVKKDSLIKEKNHLQQNHPGFGREILVYNVLKDVWENAGIFPFEIPVATTAVLINDEIILPSGEIKAGVRSPKIISGRLK